jgi:hypothetical protein
LGPDDKSLSVCPACNHELVARAVRCSNCGVLIGEGSQPFALAAQEKRPKSAGYSKALPFWKYCLLVVASFGLYELWWFYRTWAFVKDVNNTQGIWARVGATVGTAIPILNLFFMWKLLSGVRSIAAENGLPWRFSVKYLFLVYQLFWIARFVFDHVEKDVVHGQTGPVGVAYFVLALVLLFAPLLALYMVQQSVNDYCLARQNLPARKTLSPGEIIVTVLGCCIWLPVSLGIYQIWTDHIDAAGNDIPQQTTVDEPTR